VSEINNSNNSCVTEREIGAILEHLESATNNASFLVSFPQIVAEPSPSLSLWVRSRQCQGFPGNPGGFQPQSGVSRSLNRSTTIEKEASFL